MARSRKDEAPPLIATTLGKETSFSGILRFKESLRISGKFEGEIDSLGKLFIDDEAVVNARRIRASSVVVGGVVHGDIEAADRFEMLPERQGLRQRPHFQAQNCGRGRVRGQSAR